MADFFFSSTIERKKENKNTTHKNTIKEKNKTKIRKQCEASRHTILGCTNFKPSEVQKNRKKKKKTNSRAPNEEG